MDFFMSLLVCPLACAKHTNKIKHYSNIGLLRLTTLNIILLNFDRFVMTGFRSKLI
jgi:hypothetical protein